MRIIKVGSVLSDDITKIKSVNSEAGASLYSSMLVSNYGATYNWYQVPSGKKYIISYILYHNVGTSGYMFIGYGDNTVWGSGSAPTNWKNLTRRIYAGTTYTQFSINIFLEIPANKYPCMYSSVGNISIHCTGIEDTA